MNAISKFQRNHVSGPFPLKLQTIIKILDEEDESNDLIRWQPHGRAFSINASNTHATEFQEKVMKRFFHNSKVASFFRQINIYDFKRMKKGPDAGCYYHEMFVRGRPDLANAIPRNCVKGDAASDRRHSSSNESEPNFYAMEAPHKIYISQSSHHPTSVDVPPGFFQQSGHQGGKNHILFHQERQGPHDTHTLLLPSCSQGSATAADSDISHMMGLSSLLQLQKKSIPPTFLGGGSQSMNVLSLFPLLLNQCTSPTSIIGEYAGASNESCMGLSSHYEGTTGMNSSSSLALVLRLLAQRQANDLKLQQQESMQMAINDQLTTSLLYDLLSRGSVRSSMPSSSASTWF